MNKLNHVAFIMDGNGRWGIKKNKGRNYGHLNGVKTVKKVVEISVKLKIPIITFYVFSTENWKRPKSEINFLFSLIMSYFKKELENVVRNKIKINIVGKLNNLPKKIQLVLKEAARHTKNNKKIIVNLAINYGSREEIISAAKKIRKKTTKNLEKNLYTKNLPNPDILIRTGGYKRLSNFMLWQLAYTELYFLDKLWPDFNERDFKKVISNFKKVKRNFGSI
ncbi:di-trans,poly-cis-decaprenylcistransferase [bacterium TMED277]|nr:MAG: di-trans,poly-cis-decaprenylcistransferase [bacterium TMED277]|tara:strand:+ start:2181 stop:2846 length:666 start_codon:yes stop_codon:yes gene_type:complete